MPEKRYDLREIARSAIGEMPPRKRAEFLTEMLVEIDGDDALQLLADARNAVTLRLEQLVDERYPLHELAEVYGDMDTIQARMAAANSSGEIEVWLYSVPPRTRVRSAERRVAEPTQREGSLNPEAKLERIVCRHEDHLLVGSKTASDSARNRDAESTQKEVPSTPVMTAEEKLRLEQRVCFSSAPWREVLRWLNESQENGWNLPEDRAHFVGELVLRASDLSGPVLPNRNSEQQGKLMRGPK